MRDKFLKLSTTIGTFALVSMLAGCHPPMAGETKANIDDVNDRDKAAAAMMAKRLKPLPTLVVKQEPYVDHTPILIAKEPAWINRKVIIRGYQLPFSYYANAIVGNNRGEVLVSFQPGLNTTENLSINYSGTIKGALNLLASKTGYSFAIHNKSVEWRSTITRTLEVAFIPGSTDYMVGKAQGSSSSSSSSSGGGGGGSSSTTQTNGFLDDTAQAQYSNLKGTISVWKELDSTIKQMLSPQGKSVVSESTTSVTITDHPTNVEAITTYINNLNHSMSKQVYVKVEVLEIQLAKAYNYGIDWSIVQNAFGHSSWEFISPTSGAFLNNSGPTNAITNSLVQPSAGLIQTSSLSSSSSSSSSSTSSSSNPPSTWFHTLVQALEAQGKITVVSQPRIICLNNQVSTLRVINEQGYLASTQTTISGGGGSNGSTSTQLTPGTVTTGITMYVLPKIMKDKVYLQITGDLSTLLGIQNFNSATGTVSSSQSSGSTIQLPNIADKQFNQRVVLRSNETLVLSGMRKNNNQTSDANPYNMASIGAHGLYQGTDETLILITPVILPELS